MPSYEFKNLVKMTLKRNVVNEKVVFANDDMGISSKTLNRVKQGQGKAYQHTMQTIASKMRLPVKTVYYPHLDNQPMEIYNLRHQLLNSMDDIEMHPSVVREAEKIVNILEVSEGFDYGKNRQFLLCCKAWMYEMQGRDVQEIKKLIREGLKITFFQYGNTEYESLTYEEAILLHTLALSYNRIGKEKEAINILNMVANGLINSPINTKEKEKKLTAILLTLSNILIKMSLLDDALMVIKQGVTFSSKRLREKYTPDFLYNEALVHLAQGRKNECGLLLRKAYFGYILLHKKSKAVKVWQEAEKLFDITINTYGTEALPFDDPPLFKSYTHGKTPDFNSIGQLIGKLRKKAKISLRDLSSGICHNSILSKIENEHIEGKLENLEALMQRLGRDIDLYVNNFLSTEEFNAMQIRDNINSLLATRRYKEAETWLQVLEAHRLYQKGVNLQFIKYAKATLYFSRGNLDKKYLDMLEEALSITLVNFDERKIAQYRLSYYEIILINQIAIYRCETGERERGVEIFLQLKESMDEFYVDEHEKVKMYIPILYNCSKNLGILKRYHEALRIIDEGEALAVMHERLALLPDFTINRACDYLEMGEKEKSVPYFALAYYGSVLTGHKKNQSVNAAYVKEHLGIEFD